LCKVWKLCMSYRHYTYTASQPPSRRIKCFRVSGRTRPIPPQIGISRARKSR
jgi:hypothetical protein